MVALIDWIDSLQEVYWFVYQNFMLVIMRNNRIDLFFHRHTSTWVMKKIPISPRNNLYVKIISIHADLKFSVGFECRRLPSRASFYPPSFPRSPTSNFNCRRGMIFLQLCGFFSFSRRRRRRRPFCCVCRIFFLRMTICYLKSIQKSLLSSAVYMYVFSIPTAVRRYFVWKTRYDAWFYSILFDWTLSSTL